MGILSCTPAVQRNQDVPWKIQTNNFVIVLLYFTWKTLCWTVNCTRVIKLFVLPHLRGRPELKAVRKYEVERFILYVLIVKYGYGAALSAPRALGTTFAIFAKHISLRNAKQYMLFNSRTLKDT